MMKIATLSAGNEVCEDGETQKNCPGDCTFVIAPFVVMESAMDWNRLRAVPMTATPFVETASARKERAFRTARRTASW